MSDEHTLALLHLARMRSAGELDDAQFEKAREGLPPPPHKGDDGQTENAPEGKSMAVEGDNLESASHQEAYDPATEPHGSKALRAMHKAMYKALTTAQEHLGPLEEPDVKAHMTEHVNGLTKACKSMSQLHAKKYKSLPPLPESYDDEDGDKTEENPLETKSMTETDDYMGKGEEGGEAVLGVRPEDEGAAADDMDDEEYEHLKKSLPALERQYGIK